MGHVYRSQSRPVYPAPFFVASDHDKAKRRPKYVFTDQVDQLIREIYLNHRDAKTGFGIRPLAKKVGIPHWALKKRARKLGLARTKELPWSEPELAILSRCSNAIAAAAYCRQAESLVCLSFGLFDDRPLQNRCSGE